MTTGRRIVGAILAALMTASGCASTERRPRAGTTVSTPAPRGSGWNYAHLSGHPNTGLDRVVATGPADVWAAGFERDSPSLVHYDGRSWRDHEVPGRAQGLHRIGVLAASAPDNVWVFGSDARQRRSFAWRWDGARWQDARLDVSFPVTDAAVLGPDDVWVVGDSRSAKHWDGRRWRTTPMPAIATALAGVKNGDVWAVGRVETRGEERGEEMSQPAAMRWNGRAWRLVPTPEFHFPEPVPPEATADLDDVVALGPDDVWAIGVHTFNHGETDDEPVDPPPIFLHWDGSRWTRQSLAGFHCCQRLSPDGTGGIVFTYNRAWVRDPGGRLTRPAVPPSFTGLRGRTDLTLKDVANVPGTTTLWGVGHVAHDDKAGNHWARAAVVRYR